MSPSAVSRQKKNPTFAAFLPQFLLFPFAPRNVWKLLLMAASSLLVLLMPQDEPANLLVVLGTIVLLALWQAFRAMDLSVYGRLSAAAQKAPFRNLPDRIELPTKIGIMSAVLFSLGLAAIWHLPDDEGWYIAGGISVFAPAILMRLYATNSVLNSLKPQHWLRYIRKIGAPYAIIWLVEIAACLIPAIWQESDLSHQFEITLAPVVFVWLYLNLMFFHMLGFVLFTYHDALGLSEQLAFEEASTASGDELSTDALIATRLEHGQINEAIAIARNALRRDPERIKAHERLFRLLLTAGDREGAKAQCITLFAVALRQGRRQRALRLYRELQDKDDFSLAAGQVIPLAQMAVQEGDIRLAVNLLGSFDKRFPDHPDIPVAYLYSAQLIHGRFGKNDLARGILETLLARYPNHALAAEARRMLVTLTP